MVSPSSRSASWKSLALPVRCGAVAGAAFGSAPCSDGGEALVAVSFPVSPFGGADVELELIVRNVFHLVLHWWVPMEPISRNVADWLRYALPAENIFLVAHCVADCAVWNVETPFVVVFVRMRGRDDGRRMQRVVFRA